MRKLILSVVIVFSLGLSAVRVDAEPKGGSPAAPYTCNAKECTCVGDNNCGKMFGSGVCTGGMLSTNCETGGKEPVCTCVNAARASGARCCSAKP